MVLLLAEDLLPTGGALGLLAVGCLAIVLFVGFSESTGLGISYLVAEVVCVPIAYASFAFLVDKTGLKRRASLQPPERDEVDLRDENPVLGHLIGRSGRVVSTLRPSGMVEFDGRKLDGIAEAGLIPAGSEVEAVEVRSGRLIVRCVFVEGNPGPSDDES